VEQVRRSIREISASTPQMRHIETLEQSLAEAAMDHLGAPAPCGGMASKAWKASGLQSWRPMFSATNALPPDAETTSRHQLHLTLREAEAVGEAVEAEALPGINWVSLQYENSWADDHVKYHHIYIYRIYHQHIMTLYSAIECQAFPLFNCLLCFRDTRRLVCIPLL